MPEPDSGCRFYGDCLNCPFPPAFGDKDCVKGNPEMWVKRLRNMQIVILNKLGKPTEELVLLFNLAPNTIRRIVQNWDRK